MCDGHAVWASSAEINDCSDILEIILGLPGGFLSREGQFTLQFNPTWPLQQYVGGAAVWNFILAGLALALVVYDLSARGADAGSSAVRWGACGRRLLGLVLLLLNRPVLTLGQERREPSVMAFLIDDSLSMKVPDAASADGKPQGRLDAVVDLLPVRTVNCFAGWRRFMTCGFTISAGGRRKSRQSGARRLQTPTRKLRRGDRSRRFRRMQRSESGGDGTQMVPALTSVLQDVQGQRRGGGCGLHRWPGDAQRIAAGSDGGVEDLMG